MNNGLSVPSLFFVFLLVLGSCASSVPVSDEGTVGFDPAQLIVHNGRPLFLSGMNLAWIDYGKDLVNFREDVFTHSVEQIAKAGGNTIRWWLMVNGSHSPRFDENGLALPLEESEILVVKRALDIAAARGVGLLLSLFSFDLFQTSQQGVNIEANRAMVETDQGIDALISNVIEPLVSTIGAHPALIAYEIMNEPEGMVSSFGWTPQKTDMTSIQKFVNRVTGAIKRAEPEVKVTNGSWNLQVMTDIGRFANYYRDDRLIAAGGDSLGTLDFYQTHFYPEHFDDSTSPFHHPKSHWQLDKPLLIGEFSSKGIIPFDGKGFRPSSQLTTEEAFRFAIENGYAGALSWTMTNHDGHGGFFDSSLAMSALYPDFTQYLQIDFSAMDRAPTDDYPNYSYFRPPVSAIQQPFLAPAQPPSTP